MNRCIRRQCLLCVCVWYVCVIVQQEVQFNSRAYPCILVCFIVPYEYQKGDVTVGITPASSAISPVSPSTIVSLFSYFRPLCSFVLLFCQPFNLYYYFFVCFFLPRRPHSSVFVCWIGRISLADWKIKDVHYRRGTLYVNRRPIQTSSTKIFGKQQTLFRPRKLT